MFAGSGQMGIEALSRGAASAWFFEPDAAAFRLLRGNVGRLPGGLDARLYQAPYARLAQLAPKPVFDVAYIDPPFGGGLFLEALDFLIGGGYISAGGTVVCEAPRGPRSSAPLPQKFAATEKSPCTSIREMRNEL